MRARCVLNEHDANGVVVIHDTRNAGGLILARLHAHYVSSEGRERERSVRFPTKICAAALHI